LSIKERFAQKQAAHIESLYEKSLQDFYLIVAFYLVTIPTLMTIGIRQSSLSGSYILGFYALGFFAATLAEYVIHRGGFHAVRPKNAIRKNLAKVHGVHHKEPKLVGFTMLPLISSLVLLVILTLPVFILSMGNLPTTLFYFSGIATGYFLHEWSHHAIHYRKPLTAWGQHLIELHDIHHYKNPRKNFGLMSPLWDIVCGTYLPKKKLKTFSLQVSHEKNI
jgi:sterol desaturase/sphingolipid hydroxylase (fatty acid hydroxylase superfamily)